jgi:hypothetical protein
VIYTPLRPVQFGPNFATLPLNNFAIKNIFRFGVVDFTNIHPRITMQGGPLPGAEKYYFGGVYFVTGKNRTHGSLTSINGKKAPFEIVFLFHSNPNSTIEDQGIGGSEVLLHFQGKISPLANPNYAPIIAGLKKVVKAGTHTYASIPNLKSLFPRKPWERKFYTYTGSSFVPPCTEGRIRIVYKQTIKLSAEQVKAIRGLYDESNKYIWNNYRPLQSNRYIQVFKSWKPKLRPTTKPPVKNIIEDPYGPPELPTTQQPIKNIVEEDPYGPPPTTHRPRNIITTTEPY